jgi:hypothetical protein
MTLSQMAGVSSIVKAPLTPTLSPQAGAWEHAKIALFISGEPLR